ncbi:MAG: hypothetical protein ACI4UX_02515 [Clostridia bacterium]
MKKQKGITLIALIITIIVMLILVGVTITVAINGGLFGTAKESARKTKNARIFEQIQSATLNAYNTEKLSQSEIDELAVMVSPEQAVIFRKFPKEGTKLYEQCEPMRAELIESINSGYSANLSEDATYEEIWSALMIYEIKPGITQEGLATLGVTIEGNIEDLTDYEVWEIYIKYAFGPNLKEEGIIDSLDLSAEDMVNTYYKYVFKESELELGNENKIDMDKLLNELNTIDGVENVILVGNKEIGIIDTEIKASGIYLRRDSIYGFLADWKVIVQYGGEEVTISGKGEISNPIQISTKESTNNDKVAGDITDGETLAGTESDPYLISSIEDLVAFAQKVNSGETYEGKYIKLVEDLDFKDINSYKDPNSTEFGDLNGDGRINGIRIELSSEVGKGFTPIGGDYDEESTIMFKGSFNGNYKKIKNIYINSSENKYLALFGNSVYGRIENLGLEGGRIINSYIPENKYESNFTAGIATVCYQIKNCYVSLDEIKGTNASNTVVAGIAIGGIIKESYNTTNLKANYSAYGIAKDGRVVNCYNTGNITVTGGLWDTDRGWRCS